MDEQTTIVGRPTYTATWTGRQDAAAIQAAITATGYPADDITLLFRPAGGDAALDLISGENAAGQDADARAATTGTDDAGTTLLILHPEAGQVAAIRSAVQALNGTEFEYEQEERVTGDDTQARIEAARATGVPAVRTANLKEAGESIDTDKQPDDDNRDDHAPKAPPADQLSASRAVRFGAPDPTGDPLMEAVLPDQAPPADTAAVAQATTHPTPPPPLPDSGDLKERIYELKSVVDYVKNELE
jgi:hypothetical protein